jgi:hypothetical protein
VRQKLLRPLAPLFQKIVTALSVKKQSIIAESGEYRALREELVKRQPDNVACSGYKVYSQNDEDGIISEIFSRIGGGGTFLEIGIENGRECNTHLLLLKDWRGCWIEANAESCAQIRNDLGRDDVPGKFRLIETFARRDNIADLYRQACSFLDTDQLDFFSLDIDSNDLHVLEAMLSAGARPAVLCVEYNGQFPPPLSVTVEYSDSRPWGLDDYFGASLQAFDDLAGRFGYVLVTCNLVGINAFYVLEEKAGPFARRPIEELYQPMRLYLTPMPQGHRPTLKFLRDKLSRSAAP